MARYNPFAFTPGPVIFFTTAIYIALFAALLVTHLTVPVYPSTLPAGINLTEAWSDLENITRQFHPYNSHANDQVRSHILSRIHHIIESKRLKSDQIEVLDDLAANATFSSDTRSIYFEGTNVIVAIRGSLDDETFNATNRRPDNGGVLVNSHYDSVSSGYGATDDGVGVMTMLQLLSHFTEPDNWPKKTVVLLFNNGEEDFLNGAIAFMRNPISRLPHTFVNLEGAGAGGKASLFRSTDAEVTRYYKNSPYPFGTVVSGDGFKKRLIRSETDYKIFHEELGLRGLDIAFIEPRARYHTTEDSTRETSKNSIWHMLSTALATTAGLASETGTEFSGSEESLDNGRIDTGTGSDGVWFDLFGKAFVVFRMHTLFALCVTLLVVAPLILIGLTIGLSKAGKNYLFARKAYIYSPDDDEPIHLYGWRGFFRFPAVFVIATAIVVALAYLMVRVNPFIIYSSPFAVWSTMLSAWFSIAWFFSRGADAMRPSALHRMYALIWLFVGSFVLLTAATVFVNNYQVAGGYFAMFYFAAVFIAIVLSYLELFFAPTKAAYARHFAAENVSRRNSESASRPVTGSTSAARSDNHLIADDESTETTSLLRGDRRGFARYGGRRESASDAEEDHFAARRLNLGQVYPGEQEWSGRLPSWVWIIQLLLVAPIVIVLVGQIALLLTSALYQTPSDGNSPLLIYIAFAALSVLLLAPVGPFIHRFTHHIPTFLFLVCVGTVIYNLAAFPFSRDHRLKVYFVQRVNCDTGTNTVSLTGLNGYVQRIVDTIPSAQGQQYNCSTPDVASRRELQTCKWQGLDAKVVPEVPQAAPFNNKTLYGDWLDYTVKKGNDSNRAVIRVLGQNTRSCRIEFDVPITELAVAGGVSDPRFKAVGETGSLELRLWHREFSQPWNVSVRWDASEQSKLSGKVVCLWSDANSGAIPAFDEVQHYLPVWAIPSKIGDGLVEGYRRFEV